RGRMDEAASATKALGLDEPPIGGSVEGVGSDTESEAEVAPMSVIAEPRNIDMRAEHLPNSDEAEAAFAEVAAVTVADVQAAEDNVFTTTVATSASLPEHVLSGRTTLQLSEGLSTQKATLIVVHTDGSIVEATGLKSAATITSGPQTPPTPLTPLQDKDSCSKYNWDPSVYNNELPVRCRNTSGVLYKNRLGSGGKGRCIKHNQQWFAPTEFEALAGRASSKDWKRSIRYAGRPLLCLIQVLNCATATLEDLNILHKNRKKKFPLPALQEKKKRLIDLLFSFTVSPSGQFAASSTLTFDRTPTSDAASAAIISDGSAQGDVFASTTAGLVKVQLSLRCQPACNFLPVLTTLPALAVAPQPIQAKVAVASAASDHHQRTTNHLPQCRRRSLCGSLSSLKCCVLLLQEMCVNCGRLAMSECTGCHKVNYCSTFCQRKDWKDHQHLCCQSSGGVCVPEEEPITAIDMDKVK
uniref:DEAF1 transcription factor n=1 Tax=Poecilia reticulata TaxID=8081 RepID=A0A3P9N1C4_POERE